MPTKTREDRVSVVVGAAVEQEGQARYAVADLGGTGWHWATGCRVTAVLAVGAVERDTATPLTAVSRPLLGDFGGDLVGDADRLIGQFVIAAS
jgi:hypothetical protein